MRKKEKLSLWHYSTICTSCNNVLEEYELTMGYRVFKQLYKNKICPKCGIVGEFKYAQNRVIEGEREIK